MLDRFLENMSFEVEQFALCMLEPNWRLTLPGPPVAMMHFVVQGDGWLGDAESRRNRIGTNCLAIVPAGLAHSIETTGEIDNTLLIDGPPEGKPLHHIVAGNQDIAEMVVCCGVVNARFGETIDLFNHLRKILVVDLSAIAEVPVLFQRILSEQSNTQLGGPVLQDAIMTQLMVHMFRSLSTEAEAELPWLAALYNQHLAAALEAVMSDPSNHHTVESLAIVAHMSRSTFARAFHESFNSSPMKLVNQIRMELAIKLLDRGPIAVERLMTRVGFSSRSHFTQAFKDYTGVTPAKYRHA